MADESERQADAIEYAGLVDDSMSSKADDSMSSKADDSMSSKEDDSELPSCSQATGKRKRFEVLNWHATALWSWDVDFGNCAICRNQIMDPCIECQANLQSTDGEPECTIAWGVCNHAYHYHCISRWLRTREVCPLDNMPWAYKESDN